MTEARSGGGAGQPSEDRRAAEARAILARVRQETEPQIGAGAAGLMANARGHFAARDVDQGDAIEVLGTRIGRLLGLFGFLVLAMLLAARLFYD